MLNWAKKHVRHKHKDAPDEQENSETEVSSERKESSGRKSSPEKKLGSEKRTPSFARRFASIRKLAAERRSPEKGSRGKSKSPEKGLRAESGSPGAARKPDQSTDEIEPSHQESCVSESSSSEMQLESSSHHRASPNRQSLEDREASSSPTVSPTVCLSKETQPDLEQKPSEEADHIQTSQQLTTKDSQSAGDAAVDEVQKSDTQATPESCVTLERNESPERHHSSGSDLKSDPALDAVRETGSRNLHDLVIKESDEYENTDNRDKSGDLNLVTSEDEISCKLNTIINDDSACKKEAGASEPSDNTTHQNIENDTSIEITNGVHESTTTDASTRQSREDLQTTEGQVVADGHDEPQQSTTTDHK